MALNLGMLSNVYPGYLTGQDNQARVAQTQEAAVQARMRSQEMRDDQAALSALGNAFGVAAPIPPGSPPPMAPGQASVPTPPQNMPGPPDAASAPPVPLMPPQAPPVQAAPPQVSGPPAAPPVATSPDAVTALGPPQAAGAPPARPAAVGPPQVMSPQARPPAPNTSSGAQPPAGTATPRPVVPPAQAAPAPRPALQQQGRLQLPQYAGMMTVEDLAQRIIKANPGIEKRPDVLVRAISKGQQLLAPEAKAELAGLQIQQKIDAANQKMEMGQLTLVNRLDMIQQANQWRLEIEKLKQTGANDRLTASLEEKLDALTRKIAGDQKKVETQQGGLNYRAGVKNRADNVKLATKAGLKVDPSWDDETLQNKTAEALDKKNSAQVFSDEEAEDLAKLGLKDPAVFNHLGYGQAGNQNRKQVWIHAFRLLKEQGKTPEDIAAARVAITGSLQEARTVGAQAGSVRLGTEELEEFAPLVLAASEKVQRTQYPTVNKIMEAVQQGTGGTEIVTLANNIQALKNAYTQILVRNGRPSDAARRAASELIDKAWSTGQIKAAIDAMRQEAAGAGRAAQRAGAGVASEAAGNAPPPAAAPATEDDDPYGIR